MILTYADTEMIETPKGGFKRASLEAVGVEWPPPRGWRQRLIGTEVAEADFLRAIEISESPRKRSKWDRKLEASGQQSLI